MKQKMDKKSTRERSRTEKNRITRLLKRTGVPEEKLKLLQNVINNTAYLKAKLDDAQEQLEDEPLTTEYNHGEKQGGMRVNPFITAYESLWKSYMSGMKVILDAVPSAMQVEVRQKEETRQQTMLDMVRNKHRKEA